MKPIREVIDNFSGGLNTLFSARDLINSQFQELKNFVIRVKGKITKSLADDNYYTGGDIDNISTVNTLINGRGFHIYRTSKSIAGTDASTEFGVVYLREGSSTSHNLYRFGINPSNDDANALSSTFNSAFWTTRSNVLIDFYSQNEILRISDGYFSNNNKSLWYGHVEKDVLGRNIDYTKSPTFENPSSVISNPDIDDWVFDYQKIDAPKVVKMKGFGDTGGEVDSAGKVGVFIYDPRTQIQKDADLSYELDAWEQWGYALEPPFGNTFSKDDRWTVTFTYDYVNESELGRNVTADNEIGVTGFNTVDSEPELEVDEKVYTYDVSNESTEIVLAGAESSSETVFSIGRLGAADADAAASFDIGDLIRINDEILKVLNISSSNLTVARGVLGSKVPNQHDESSKIYKVRKKQCARAVNVVLYTGTDVDAGNLNKRITSVNIYWKPVNEVDWYLVDILDINKGATMNKIAPKPVVAQSTGEPYGWYGSKEYLDFFTDTGRWMLCPNDSETERLGGSAPKVLEDVANSGTHLLKTASTPYGSVVEGDICFSTPQSFSNFTAGNWDAAVTNASDIVRNAICANVSTIEHKESTSLIYNGASVLFEEDSTGAGSTYFPILSFVDVDGGTDAYILFADNTSDTNDTNHDPSKLGFKANQRLHICPLSGTNFDDSGSNIGMYIISSVTSTKINIKKTSALSADEIAAGIKGDFTDQLATNETSIYLIASTGVNHYNYKYPNLVSNTYTVTDDVLNATPMINDAISDGSTLRRHHCIYSKRTDAVTTMYIPFYGDKDNTYTARTGRTESTRVRDVKWKCSTIVNNIAVIGNIKTMDDNGKDVLRDDRIMWSRAGVHDDFILARSRDMSITDSGEITNLVAYSQYVYVVKTNAVYVTDSTQNFRSVGSYNNIGSNYYGGAISTPYGVVVANQSKVVMLPDNVDISETIKDTYQSATFSSPTLSFNSDNNELRIVPETDGECFEFIYNFTDKSWSQRHKSGDDHSNYLTAFNGSEFYIAEISGTFYLRQVENGSEKANNTAIMHTKDFHFGDTSRKKFISDLYISYKSSADFSIFLYIDGFQVWEKSLKSFTNKKTKRLKVNREGRLFSFKIESPYGASGIEIDDIVIEGWHLDRH